MVDKTIPTKDERTVDVYDTMRDNLIRTVDEFAKAQPQYSQSISNLQLDYIQTTKNMIQTSFSAQKQLANTLNVPSVPYGEVFTRQSNEVTNNLVRSVGINNQLTINALDAARENLKIYREIERVHPQLAQGIKFVDMGKYQLERFDAEKKTEKKRQQAT